VNLARQKRVASIQILIEKFTRRTAVRNMERAQVRRADARQISGHRTESVYVRYDIASEQGAFEAAEKLRDFHAKQQARKIVGYREEQLD
jgi:hypothetical protein